MESLKFHNTTNQNAEFVLAESRNCKSQEQIIYQIFKEFGRMTASEVLAKYPKPILLTSVRRSLSNLKFSQQLIKLDETNIGMYKKPEHYYQIANNQLILF